MCFSLGWIAQLLIWLVVVCAVVAVVRILLPMILGPLGGPTAVIIQILRIIMWAVVCIFAIWVVFDLLQCLVGFGGHPLGYHR